MQITTERYEILKSGSLIVSSDDYIQFDIMDLRFRFIFLNEINNKNKTDGERVEWHTERDADNKEFLLVSMINFESLDTRLTMTEFLNLASHDGRRVLVNFIIDPLQNSSYLMHYTWYLEK